MLSYFCNEEAFFLQAVMLPFNWISYGTNELLNVVLILMYAQMIVVAE